MTPPIILDIEASGFGRDSYPIEIGFVMENGESWCRLIHPEPDWVYWDPAAENVHKIPRRVLLERGDHARAIAQELNDLLLNKTVYSDGWAHDYVWLANLFEAAGFSCHFKLDDLRSILTPDQQAQWHDTKGIVENTIELRRHRASSDAKIIQLTWIQTKSFAAQAATLIT